MVDVSRWHEVDPAYVLWRLETARDLASLLLESDRKWNSGRFSSLLGELKDIFVWSLVAERAVTDESWWALDAAAVVARAQFERAFYPKFEHRFWFDVGGHEVTTMSSGPGVSYTSAPFWLEALWIGLISRDVDLLAVLRDFKVEWMVEAETAAISFDPYHLEWAKAWQMLLRGERGDVVGEQVVEVLRLTDPALSPVAGEEFMLDLAYPSVRLLWDVVSGERGEFSADVLLALEGHKRYFNQSVDNRMRGPDSFVAWPVLGTVCAAVDSDFPVDVDSEYLPRALVFDRKGRAYE